MLKLSLQKGYKGSQGAILKIMGKAMFCYKMHCPKKTSCFCARSGGSLYLGFEMLFECRNSYFPPLKNFNETWNQSQNLPHLLLGEYLLWVYRYMISVSTRTAVSLSGKTEKKVFPT